MEQMANYYTENDNTNTAQWLRSIAQGLVEAMGFNSVDAIYQDYLNCLMEILQKNEYYQQLDQHLQKLHQQAMTTAQEALAQGDENYQKHQQTAAKIALQINGTLPQHCQEKYPFASPFYWAGFISQGLA
jgi:CHAT domain-containing protein